MREFAFLGARHAAPPPAGTGPATAPGTGVTPKAIAVGLVGSAVLGVLVPWSDLYLRGTLMAACHLPIGAFMLFLVWAGAGNVILRMIAPRLAMTQRETLVSYLIMLVAAGIPSFGLTEYLIPTLAGAFYFETPENEWRRLIFRYIPQWFVPVDLRSYSDIAGVVRDNWVYGVYNLLPQWMHPAKPEIIRQFYEALPESQRSSVAALMRAIPWGAWAVPLAAWTGIAYALFFIFLCTSVILRRQWVERERLAFPLVQIPLEIARPLEAGSRLPAFFRSRMMWLGFCGPFLIHAINGLHVYYPSLPTINLAYNLAQYLLNRPWSQVGHFQLLIHFSVIGFSFLIPTDLSFSLWFFFFLYKLQGIIIAALGYDLQYVPGYAVPTFAAYQMLGAFFALAAGMLWTAREHLRVIGSRTWAAITGHLRQPAGGGPSVEEAPDTDEALPYHVALLGLLVGLLALAGVLAAAGMSYAMALASLVIFAAVAIVLARFVAEGGLLFIQAPFRPSDIIMLPLGTRLMGVRNLTVLAYLERALALQDSRDFVMPYFMDTWRMCDSAGISKRRLLPSLIASIVIATALSYAALLIMAYRYGAVTMEGWFAIGSPKQPFDFLRSYLVDPREPSVGGMTYTGVGALVMWALVVLRMRFTGWPLHPIGYAMGPSWPMIQLWFSIMAGWLCKLLILRWGGMRGFLQARPFFLGLVLGEFAAGGAWIVIDSVTGMRGHRFFLF